MVTIDTDANLITMVRDGKSKSYDLGTPEGFHVISELWLRSGWDNKYVYGFSWMGRPIIQLPEDMIRMQEVIYQVRPDVIIETGVAHGGSLIFYACLCKAMNCGRVIGVDIEIRPHNRRAIEAHEVFPYITLIEGSSTAAETVETIKAALEPTDRIMCILDSNHSKQHVLAELEIYAPLVSVGSYIVAMDGIMERVVGAPRTQPQWTWDNPRAAAVEFVERSSDFEIVEPDLPFNEGAIAERVTYCPSGFIKRAK